MNQSKISVRYAKAIFMSALEGNQLDKVRKDFELIIRLHSQKMFRDMLESPVIRPSVKKSTIDKILSARISELSLNFLNLLITNNREIFIPDIARNFDKQYKLSKGIKKAELTVSRKTDARFKATFVNILKKTFKSEIELEEQIDPQILGGFILRVEDEQYDASVESDLSKIRKKLLETTSVKKI